MDNFHADFIGAMIGAYMGIFGLIFRNNFWAIIGGSVMVFFVFSIVIKVIIECEFTTPNTRKARLEK